MQWCRPLAVQIEDATKDRRFWSLVHPRLLPSGNGRDLVVGVSSDVLKRALDQTPRRHGRTGQDGLGRRLFDEALYRRYGLSSDLAEISAGGRSALADA